MAGIDGIVVESHVLNTRTLWVEGVMICKSICVTPAVVVAGSRSQTPAGAAELGSLESCTTAQCTRCVLGRQGQLCKPEHTGHGEPVSTWEGRKLGLGATYCDSSSASLLCLLHTASLQQSPHSVCARVKTFQAYVGPGNTAFVPGWVQEDVC